jgi:hypothetical protein
LKVFFAIHSVLQDGICKVQLYPAPQKCRTRSKHTSSRPHHGLGWQNQPDKHGILPFRDKGIKAMKAPALITYPVRSIQGGRLELAPPKRGLWYAEPKLNGRRAIIHTLTGTMWNRHGALLTIADCFRPALAALAKLAPRDLVWADCEALERRHDLGRGTLIVLYAVPESGTPTYEERRAMLESLLPVEPVFSGDTSYPAPNSTVAVTPTLRANSHASALPFYQRLREANRILGCDFFEGVAMKRADSIYPVQVRSATDEFRAWVKHRFLT